MRFASSTNRGASLTGPSAPVEGMVGWLKDANSLEVYDGSAWQEVIRGTLGWSNVSLTSGYEPWSGATVAPRVRRVGPIVYLEGRMQKSSGSIPGNSFGLVLGTVPSGYRPVGHYAEGAATITTSGSGAPVGRIEVLTTGEIKFYAEQSTSWVGFSNWWFVT